MRRLTRALCVPAIAGLVVVCGEGALRASQTPTTEKPRLSGQWQLNKEASSLQDQQSSSSGSSSNGSGYGGGRGGGMGRGGGGMGGRGGGGMGRGGGGMGGMGGGGMGRGGVSMTPEDEEKQKVRRALMQEVMETDATFTIIEGDGTISFTHPDGRVVAYKTDGKKEKHQLTNGTIETKTKWDKDTQGLVIEMDLGDGAKVTHTYTVTGSPRQLADSIKMEGGHSRGGQSAPTRHHIYDEVPTS
jgi:hypothetical protein